MLDQVTFVIQGKFPLQDYESLPAVKTIQKNFPESAIVLSTWGLEGKVIDLGDKMKIVVNKELKNKNFKGDAWSANFHRQARTVISGLNLVQTKYACKIRSDCFFEDNSLRMIFCRFIKSNKKYIQVEKFLRFPYFNYGSDWFQIGRTSNLKEIWGKLDATTLDLEYYDQFKAHHHDNLTNFYARFHSEQLVYKFQFDVGYEGRHIVPTSIQYLQQRYAYKAKIFMVGKKDIGLNSKKYPNKKLDRFPYFLNCNVIYFFKIIFEIIIGRILCLL